MPIGEIVISSELNIHYETNCFICLENVTVKKPLLKPCLCRGTNFGVHKNCLEIWIEMSGKNYCMVCKQPYYYSHVYNPSFNRFMEQLNCYECHFSSKPIVCTVLVFLLIIQLLILTIIYELIHNFPLDLFVLGCIVSQLMVLSFLYQIDKNLNFISSLKYLQLVFSIMVYIYIPIILQFEDNTCNYECYPKECNKLCNYYETYQEKYQNNFNAIIYQSIVLGIVFLTDFLIKIKKGMYQLQIQDSPTQFIPVNNIYPIP